MIRLTQPEIVHDKKEKDSSSPDDSTPAIKKEADSEPVTSHGTDQAASGTSVGPICPIFVGTYLVKCVGACQNPLTETHLTVILDSVDESGAQSKDATSHSRNSKVMGKPPAPTGGGLQQITSTNPIVQRLPAFLDNHNYAKSPMQVEEKSSVKVMGQKVSVSLCAFACVRVCVCIFRTLFTNFKCFVW